MVEDIRFSSPFLHAPTCPTANRRESPRHDQHPHAHQKVTQSRHPPGVDTEPRDDDVENAAWADEPARSTAQRQFVDAARRPLIAPSRY